MKYIKSISVLWIFFSVKAFAQTPIQTDRPDQTECPYIVPLRFIQIESGISAEKKTKENISYSHPSLLVKYGISKTLELRLISEIVSEKLYDKIQTGYTPVTVGFKANLFKENGVIPLTSFIGHLSIGSIASFIFKTTYLAPSFRFTMQHSFSDKCSLGYNIGAEWDGESPEPIFIYTLTTGFSLSEKIGSYIEIYGFAPQKNKADHRTDAGFTYLINNNCMVDVSGGLGLSANAPKKYFAVGFSFRFNSKK